MTKETKQRGGSKLNVATHLGIAVELVSQGHNVHVFTAYHDKNRCFEETVNGEYDKHLRENVEYFEELKCLAERNGVADREERSGIVPLKAAAYKPVIASNSGGPVETIKNKVTGFLCNPTPKEFFLAMAKFI